MSLAAAIAPDYSRKLWVLRNFDLFKCLNDEELTLLAANSNNIEFGRNEHICMSGTRHTHAYLVKEGNVRIVSTNANGRRLTLGILNPGELIGDIDLFGQDMLLGQSAESMGDTRLYAIPLDILRQLVESKPELTLVINKRIGERHMQILNRMQDVMFLTVPQRLAKLYRRLANEYPGTTKSGRRFIDLRLTHAEIADLIGSNREAVSATHVKWKEEGPIQTVKGFMVIHNEDLLESIANS